MSEFTIAPDLLAAIVDRFGARVEQASDQSMRFPLRHCPARAYVRGGVAPAETVELIDLATRSVGFTSHTRFITDDPLVIELEVPGIPRQMWPCRVVRSQLLLGGTYRVGARFEAA